MAVGVWRWPSDGKSHQSMGHVNAEGSRMSPRPSKTGCLGSRYGENRASPILPSGCQTHQGAKGSWRMTDGQSPLALNSCAGQEGCPLFYQNCSWFMTHLARLSHSKLLWGAGGSASTHPWPAGSKNGWKPHGTLSCLRELIPQASQRYFRKGGGSISHIPPHW